MRRIPIASLLLVAGLLQAAENAPSVSSLNAARSPLKIDAAERPVPAHRVMSPGTAAKLAAAAPKYAEPQPAPSPTQPASPVAARPTERGRSPVVQLPEFVVGEPKLNLPDSLEVLTPKGRVELAFQRHPGLRMVPFAWMNAGVALELLEDDLQAQRRAQAADLLSLYLIR